MRVRAKFECTEVSFYKDGASVKLHAVYDDDPNSENGKFFKYTPSGTIELSIVNPTAAKAFEAGQEYYVDFLAVAEKLET